ncbi:MAG: helix-turn-helix domain-containing protein [Pseudomonadota bacterium]
MSTTQRQASLTGSRIREKRQSLRMRQAELARRAGISASYLNLIEHNRRRIGGKLLIAIAGALEVEPLALSEGAEASLLRDLAAASEAMDAATEIDRVQEFAGRFPGWAALVARQSARIGRLEETLTELNDRLTHDPFLSAQVHEMLSTITAIRSTSSILADDPDLDRNWRVRFHGNLREDAMRLASATEALVSYLDAPAEGVDTAQSPQDEVHAWLDKRRHYLPELEAQDAHDAEEPADLSGPARRLAEAHIALYLKEARLLPQQTLSEALSELGPDPLAIARALDLPLDAVLRRLGQVPETGEGVGLAECDGTGALITRRAPETFPFPRTGVGRSLWPLFSALSRPHVPIRAELGIVEGQAARFTAFAYAATRDASSYGAEPILRATMLLIPT